MPTALELRESRAQIWERMKQINQAAEAENRDLSAEEKTNWNTAETDMTALEGRIVRQEKLERKPADAPHERLTAAVLTNPTAVRATKEYGEAFRRWLCAGEEAEDRQLLRAGAQEVRAMATTSPTGGMLAVPETMTAGIERAMLEYGGMREVASVRRTADGGDLIFLTSDDTGNTGEILAEGVQASEQDATVSAKILKAFTYSSKIVRVSLQLLQDASFDVEGYIAAILGERIGRITNTHFTTGTGANQPSGIVDDSTSGVAGATGQSTTVTWDDLVSLEHSVGMAYRRGARFMFADGTLQALRKLKDGEGRYLWQPGQPVGGFPNTIMQYPYTVNDDVAAMAASAKSILFGQLSRYIIRDVRPYALMRFAEKYMDYLQIGFMGFSRHDGALIDAGTHPVKYYSNSAS